MDTDAEFRIKSPSPGLTAKFRGSNDNDLELVIFLLSYTGMMIQIVTESQLVTLKSLVRHGNRQHIKIRKTP